MDETLQKSHILLTDSIEESVEELKTELAHTRKVFFIKEDFLLDDAKEVIREAYIAEAQTKYLILGAKSFNTFSQNALLKVLEEPPRNIIFILLSSSKSALLPTIRSRLIVKNKKEKAQALRVDLEFSTLSLKQMYAFVKEHTYLKRHDAKAMLEALFLQATLHEGLKLTQEQLDAFDRAYRLLELNGRFQTVLTQLLSTFIKTPSKKV